MSYKSRPDGDRPITDVCIVSRQDSFLAGFDVLHSMHDTHDDCNLWPDSFFGSRTERYLCFSRNVQRQFWSEADRVLVDILVTGEKDIPPTGFTAIHHTRDTREKASKKKMICVKMKSRKSVQIAICEMIMVNHKRNIPQAFNVKGELNGMTLCARLISILPTPLPLEKLPSPLHQQQQKQSLPQVQQLSMQPGWMPPHPSSSQYDPYRQQATRQSGVSSASTYSTGNVSPSAGYNTPYSSSPPFSGIQQRFSLLRDNPLKGVPFVLDKSFLELEEAYKIKVVETSYRSPVDLDNEYSYSFDKEEKAVQMNLPNRNS